jgi:sulfopyruvate decarboxylase alpha subunit
LIRRNARTGAKRHWNEIMNAAARRGEEIDWQNEVYDLLRHHEVTQFAYVPDAGHRVLIERCLADPNVQPVALTTEEEGVALLAGADLGGARGVLLMQSSGVGNCVNMLSLARTCRFPLLMLITMRGEWEEFNPWQVPMGGIVEPVLKLCEAEVYRALNADEVEGLAERAVQRVFGDERIAAVLLSQQLIGKKVWTK